MNHSESKHYVSMELWPWPAYPSYLYGGCYLLGRKALAPLLTAAQSTPYFPFEDLYLIGLCSRKAHVPLWTFDKSVVASIIMIDQSIVTLHN
jgi:hypothetical protein